MNSEEKETYKKLVTESLAKKEKDYYALVEDIYVGWRFLNSKKNMRNPRRSLKLIKRDLSTEILPKMVERGEITIDFGGAYKLGK